MWLVDDLVDRAGALPGLAISGLTLWGFNLQSVVYVLTIVYLVLQIAYFIWKRYSEWKDKKK